MQEPEVVAAIVAGDLSGLTEALDSYAAPLFALCRSMLPEAEAAEVLMATFVTARQKLGGLREPSRLGSWLELVARNDCYRRLIASQTPMTAEALADARAADVALPEGLTGRILKVCTDDSATGRAHRTTMAHQAGTFGHDGFPKLVTMPRQLAVRQRRQPPKFLLLVGTIAAAIIVVAGIIVISGSVGSHPSQTAAAAAVITTSPPAGGGTSTGASPEPAGTPVITLQATRPAARKSSPPRKPSSPAPSVTSAQPALAQPPAAPPVSAPATQPPTKPSKPAVGKLRVSTGSLTLTSRNNSPAHAIITITASGGPVSGYSVSLSTLGGHIFVTPASGSLGSGQQAQLLVTAWNRTSFTATITVYPGGASVTVSVFAMKTGPK
jgi:hypothetical protein